MVVHVYINVGFRDYDLVELENTICISIEVENSG